MLPRPQMHLSQVFTQIKSMQRENLNELTNQIKEEKGEDEVKGLKFIARKLKILLEKNRRIQYNDASRILINNFATAEKDERNIKRRVYDAINVLVAAEVITKDNNKIELASNKKRITAQSKQHTVISSQRDAMVKIIENIRKKIIARKNRKDFLEKLSKKKKTKKEQKILQPKLALFSSQIDEIKFKKQKKKTLIIFEGGKIIEPAFLPLADFIFQNQPY